MKKTLLVTSILVAAAIFGWWRHKPEADAGDDDVKPVAQVQVVPLAKAPIARTLMSYGIVESSAGGVRTVVAAYDCLVRDVDSAAGARVSAGDRLLSVEPTPDERLQLDSARSVAALAERALASVRQRYDLRLATEDELRSAEQADEDARLKRESLEQRGIGDSPGSLTAPVAGIVVKLDVQPGVMVPAGTAMAVIANSGRLEARLGLEPSDADAVRVGQSVALTSVAGPGSEATNAVVAAVGAVADAGTGSIDVRVPLGDQGRWFPGERVKAEIEVERKVAWVVPRSAVLPEDGEEVMYTAKDGRAVKHAVQVGISSGDRVELSAADLEAGDSVVVQGNYELSDGMAVQIQGGGAGLQADEKREAKP